jgi:lysine 2,3-aminomutase
VGTDTAIVNKTRFLPIERKWEAMFDYIARTERLADILVSGGDTYTLSSPQLRSIVERLLRVPHILRVRVASKGMAICPGRLMDKKDDWANTLIYLAQLGRKMGKSVALHTHFNHPNEITWITRLAAQRLFEEGVVVRNQTVLLNGVNNNVVTMSKLINELASINIQPVRVTDYRCLFCPLR